jgi:hypothetical protein
VSLARLYFLRFGYLLVAVGLVVTKWPLLLHHPAHWPLMDGVETSMLVAMSLLFILGLRYPLQMLPILLFESLWKLIWVSVVVAPLWAAGRMDAATWQVVGACAVVLVVVAVIPGRYVVTSYLTQHGDRWRSGSSRPR